MIDRALADLVLIVHLVFIVFVLLGGLLALRFRWAPLVHLPAACWGVWVEATGRTCPLTPLENALRERAGVAGYPGSFVEHYLLPWIYPAGLTPAVQWLLAAIVVFVNVAVYMAVRRRRHELALRSNR